MSANAQTYLVPTINTMMTGVTHYTIAANGIIKLHYEDGSTETARPTWTPDPMNVFQVTSAVQAMRREA